MRDVLIRMSEEGITPREDTYNTLMSAALASGNVKQVPELFDQLVNQSLTPSSLSYTSLITALGRMRDSTEAVSLLHSSLQSLLKTKRSSMSCNSRGK